MMLPIKKYLIACVGLLPVITFAQARWMNVDSAFQPLPAGFHVYKTTDGPDGKAFIAYYAEAPLKNKTLDFTVDTTRERRLIPTKFYERNDRPLLVVNCSFFSYETNRSLNTVIKNGKLLAFNSHSIPMKGKDTFQYRHTFESALGISKKRKADVAWLYTDSVTMKSYAVQFPVNAGKDSIKVFSFMDAKLKASLVRGGSGLPDGLRNPLRKWKMRTAVGGGPVLLQQGQVKISNNEELKFAGKAIDDKHPRTAMGYTKDGRLIMMVTQGRFPGIAEGATLTQEAQLLKDIGCEEALNLDGGGSSCMLINGKETIKPSEKGEERAVPAVFIIRNKH